jgi:hypothetical protein
MVRNDCLLLDTFISKTKKLYADTRSQRNVNLSRVTEDLTEVNK